MAQDRILSLEDKIQLVARDIYDRALLKNSLQLEHFVPSKQVQNLLDEDEYVGIINYLYKHGILTFAYREMSVNAIARNAPKGGFSTYRITISQPKIRFLLGLKDSVEMPIEKGISLHPDYSYLIIDGKEIPLAKGKLHKSLQYWICFLCLKKPNQPVEETDIMEKYASDYDVTGRSRSIRDAVYRLNPKIQQATGINGLFTYSNGYVIFNADKLE